MRDLTVSLAAGRRCVGATVIALATCLGPITSLPVQAQTLPAQTVQTQAEQAQTVQAQAAAVQELIEQLGSDEFREREEASAELLQIGEPALLALAAAEKGTDFETRERAKAIRLRIEHDKNDELAQAFMRDADPTASHGLPGWKSFSSVAGSTRTSKRLFLEMVAQRRIVAMSLEAIDGGQLAPGVFEGLPTDPQQRLWMVIGKTAKDIRFDLFKGIRPVTGDLLALLVAAAVLDNPPQELHDAVRTEINMGSMTRFFDQPGARNCVRKMLGRWMLKAPTTMGVEIMMIALQNHVPEGADMARRLLAGPVQKEVTPRALLCLAKLGNTGDLDLIDRYVDDTTQLNEPLLINGDEFGEERTGPPGARGKLDTSPAQYRQLIGDVALAAGMKLANFDLTQFFPGIREHPDIGLLEATIGFPVNRPEVRQTALKAWREFRAKSSQPAS
jgi:hypothetical protein